MGIFSINATIIIWTQFAVINCFSGVWKGKNVAEELDNSHEESVNALNYFDRKKNVKRDRER